MCGQWELYDRPHADRALERHRVERRAQPQPRVRSSNFLNGVAAVSANDMWAVGDYESSGSLLQTLTEHWNGTVWSVVPSPSPDLGQATTLMG